MGFYISNDRTFCAHWKYQRRNRAKLHRQAKARQNIWMIQLLPLQDQILKLLMIHGTNEFRYTDSYWGTHSLEFHSGIYVGLNASHRFNRDLLRVKYHTRIDLMKNSQCGLRTLACISKRLTLRPAQSNAT